jgi:hypothetical protein
MTVVDTGRVLRLQATFRNIAGAGTDPTDVALTIRMPDGNGGYTHSTPTPTAEGSGVYHYDVQPTVPGEYVYRWDGTGAVTASAGARFYVRRNETA